MIILKDHYFIHSYHLEHYLNSNMIILKGNDCVKALCEEIFKFQYDNT